MSVGTRIVLGKRLRALRRKNKLSQEKLALMVGVERSYLSKLEAGSKNVTLDYVEKVAYGLGTTLEDLFKGIDAEAAEINEAALHDSKPTASATNYQLSKL